MPARSAGDDRDDRRDDRPALRRADAARHRLERARRSPRAGTASASARQIQRTREYVAVVRKALARERLRVRRRDAHAAAARRARQGAEAHDLARPGAHPDLPRRDRPEQHAPRRRDRRRLDPDALLARARRRVAHAARGGRRAQRAARSTASTSRRRSTSASPTTSPRAATSCARSSRSTSAAWARASRTSTTRSSARYGFEDEARDVQDLYLDGKRDEAAARLSDELHRHRRAVRAGRARPRPARRLPRGRRRDARRQPAGVHARRAPRAAAPARGARRLSRRLLLGAFGDPGHAFPMIALGRALAAPRPRRHAADVDALARGRRGAGHDVRGRARVPRLPHPRAAADALPGRRARDARHDEPRRGASRPTRSSPTSSRSRPRSPASCTACPSRRSSPTSTRARRRAARRTRAARGCRAPRVGRTLWHGADPLLRRGLELGRAQLNETRRRARPARRWTRVHGGISEDAVPRRDVPAARVSAARARAARTPSGRCCGSRRARTSRCPTGDEPLVLLAPSTSQDAEQRLLRAAIEGLARHAGARARVVEPQPAGPAAARSRPTRGSSSGCPTRARCRRCDLVVCHGGHGTVARALASGCAVVVVPAAGDMNENAARVDWAGVGVRLPRRMVGARGLRLAVGRALARPALRARARELARVGRRARRRAPPSSSSRSQGAEPAPPRGPQWVEQERCA